MLKAKLVVIKGPDKGKEFDIPSGQKIFIGRSLPDSSGIEIKDNCIGRKHAYIFMEEDNYVIADLGSKNGTFVNGQKISKSRLCSENRITMGSNTFEFIISKTPEKRPKSLPSDSSPDSPRSSDNPVTFFFLQDMGQRPFSYNFVIILAIMLLMTIIAFLAHWLTLSLIDK